MRKRKKCAQCPTEGRRLEDESAEDAQSLRSTCAVKRRLLLGVGGERRRYENRNGRQAAAGGCRHRRLRVVCPRIVWQRIGRGGRLLQCALARSAMRAQPAFAAARPLGATATSLLCRRCGNSTATGVLWPSSAGAVRAFCGRCGLRGQSGHPLRTGYDSRSRKPPRAGFPQGPAQRPATREPWR